MTEEKSSTYRKHMLRAMSGGNWFPFRRDYVTSGIMTHMEALFFQDLINLGTLPRTATHEDDYFLCTRIYLIQSLNWDRNTQDRLTASLREKDYIRVDKRGMPACRYIWINVEKVESDLDAAQSSQIQDNQSSQIQDNQSSRGRDNKSSGIRDANNNVNTEVFTKEKNTVANARSARCDGVIDPPKPLFGAEKSPPDKVLASRLAHILMKHGLNTRRPKLDKWSKDLRELMKVKSVQEINKILDWMENLTEKEIKHEYFPTPYSADSFVEKFTRLQKRMRKDQSNCSDASEYIEIPILLYQRIGKNRTRSYSYEELERKGNLPRWKWEGEGLQAKAIIIDREWQP